MRNLIVCCDGTWNTPDQESEGKLAPTNVVRLYNAVAEKNKRGVEQVRYYHPGVGTEGNWWERLTGGAFGTGLDKNIMSAYKWLACEYRSGDRIYLFGFSRGAYTVRSLAGMISHCGMLDLGGLESAETWARVEAAYEGYRNRTRPSSWGAGFAFHAEKQVHFLGAWDTVGALGIPDNLAILNLLDKDSRYRFHDTALGSDVINARHAVAMDEKRASFVPTLWSNVDDNTAVKQIWFPGVHSDVGGGYAETGLSDAGLAWMIDEATGCGLGFRPDMVGQVKPDSQDELHDSYRGLFKHMRSEPRNVPLLARANRKQFHPSALERQERPPITQAPYRPTTRLKRGQSVTLAIFADQPWNDTGIYIESGGRYTFTARGEWLDRNIACGPEGADDGHFQAGEIAHLAGMALGAVEKLYKKMTNNAEADFKGTRRLEKYAWFRLIGAIADGYLTRQGHKPHTFFDIGSRKTRKATRSGYLYCFANDAWGFYGNNKGSVELVVQRVE
jgi:hypothetical protein